MSFLIGKVRKGRGAATFSAVRGVEDDFRLEQGIPLTKGWPADAHLRMDDDFPKDVLLEDVLFTGSSPLVASARLRDLLVAQKVPCVEYLPVTLLNHKGRKEKAPYFIVNCLALQNCIDLERTKVRCNEINPDIYSRVRSLTLDPRRVAPELLLFRLQGYPFIDVYRDALAAKVAAAELTGVEFVKTEEWSII
jgi:hypothetical protein